MQMLCEVSGGCLFVCFLSNNKNLHNCIYLSSVIQQAPVLRGPLHTCAVMIE